MIDRAESISITDRTLCAFPVTFLSQCPCLKILDLSRNSISVLPPTIQRFQFLEELHAPFNEIAEIPTTIVNMSKLRILNLNDNKITVFPDELGAATHLQVLYLNNNPLNL
jgi:Leucine-rich repeat (LRR) protein